MLLLTLVVAFMMLAATPAMACGRWHRPPPSGDQVMVFNAQDPTAPFGLHGCEDMSWFGTIEIGHRTYGMALYPDYAQPVPGDLFAYGEYWKIFSGKFRTDDDGMLKRCTPGRVLMAGYDEGIGGYPDGTFGSEGTVDYAVPRFRRWLGDTVHQDGTVGMVSVAGLTDVFGFNGHFEIE